MVSDVGLYDGQPIGWHALLKDLPAQPALQDVVRPPSHLPSVFAAVEELFRQAASLHAVQSGHLIQDNGALLF